MNVKYVNMQKFDNVTLKSMLSKDFAEHPLIIWDIIQDDQTDINNRVKFAFKKIYDDRKLKWKEPVYLMRSCILVIKFIISSDNEWTFGLTYKNYINANAA